MDHHLVLLPVWIFLSAALRCSDGNFTCLSCDSTIKPRDCQYTSRCGPHEVCYTSSYATSVGTVKHRTGCRDINQCQSSINVRDSGNDILICTECCNGTLCNSGLCSQDAIPPLSKRGPICYSCDQQTDPSSCHVIKQCGLDQECMLMRYESEMGNDLIYKTQCVSRQVCAEKLAMYKTVFASSVLGKRTASSQNHCALKCCVTDLCNSDCTGDQVVSLTNTSSGHLVFSKATTASTTMRTTTTKATTIRPTAVSASCTDVHSAQYCQTEISMCTSPNSNQKNWAYQYCRRTCNLCDHQLPSTGSSCTDTWSLSSCTYYKYWCSHPSGDNYQTLKMCRKTCNVC